ncbi:concanavalin A-like lectin/glucanase domain-containing protein [Dunaliella salina]|uniref:Concanavalin A-like lectin/glucanase domain-containing protein n=1 Tax=Dunaliella salina TaxID=3046 RepID=A0ABQ7H778_DUNSA|nr:concanavalin A-like lectin/glucanase domain-containing protein [Dunaliella salina]|eukprot:KAF5842711.1 concanavalin A-like lectin/glucanase domain-containing protein [Dunaliella salina]
MAYSSKYTLPSYLDARILGRAQAALNHLKVDGTRVRYVGPGDDDSQAATIRTNAPAPPDCPLYYFEVEIVSSGHKGYIGIGFQTEDVLLSRLPGWDPHSYGYHGDDGNAFQGSGAGRSFGPTYGTGDIMGALLNRAERTISFFKNGQSLGVAFRGVTEDRLFPCVGLRTKDEEVRLNLGGTKHSAAGAKGAASKAPFVADFQAMQDSFRAKVLSDINATPLPLQSSSATPLLPQLLYDHLMHHRYWRTAAAIKQDLLQPSASSNGKPASCQGPAAAALQQTDADMAEGVPLPTEGSQGRPGKLSADEQELLGDALSLLAYDNPESAPAGHLLGQAQRDALAEAVNCAILAHRGAPPTSPLERLSRQTFAAIQALRERNHPQALMLDAQAMVFGL